MVISINPHKPVVKAGGGDNVVIGIFSFKVTILNGALQNSSSSSLFVCLFLFEIRLFTFGNLFLLFSWTAVP